MSIATEISRLQSAKADIKTAIEGKGVSVPSGTLLDGYATLIDSISGGGSGYSIDDIARNLEPSGDIVLGNNVTSIPQYALAGKPITSIIGPNVTSIGANALDNTQITDITDSNFPSLGVSTRCDILFRMNSLLRINLTGGNISLRSGSGAFRYNTAIVSALFPNASKSVESPYKDVGMFAFGGCSSLTTCDIGQSTSIGNNAFNGCTHLTKLILRSATVVRINNVNVFTNSPYASGKTGGEIYVPSDLIESYKTATNWSTMNGYGTVTWVAIEGSEFEI